jgi:hypothetical protein
MLKSGQPTRALCTSSLELGIDIGAVDAVAQIDPTWSVASMVQRLGRSGRKIGATSKLRLYVRIQPQERQVCFVELLYPSLLQAVSMVRLLLAGWLESANPQHLHLSTLVHQILSVLKEMGGQDALALYQILCRQGAFRCVEPADFKGPATRAPATRPGQPGRRRDYFSMASLQPAPRGTFSQSGFWKPATHRFSFFKFRLCEAYWYVRVKSPESFNKIRSPRLRSQQVLVSLNLEAEYFFPITGMASFTEDVTPREKCR